MHSNHISTKHLIKLSTTVMIAVSLGLTGCQSFKKLHNKKSTITASAEKSEQAYYADAQNALAKNRYKQAIIALQNIQTFYPTGAYIQQAMLDLIYAQYASGDYEAATDATAKFIEAYPNSAHADYAYYVQGVANMQGSPKSGHLFRLNQAQRDTAYLRLAFANFQTLLAKYPNSVYAPDAAQRIIFIYNQLAEHELVAARYYIQRQAYVAAANRAKWVFQYYPLSQGVPESITILAYANDKLGLTDLASHYKTLLQINYPKYLNSNGNVILGANSKKTWLSHISFGKIGRIKQNNTDAAVSQYTGKTQAQIISQASQMNLPSATETNNSEEDTNILQQNKQHNLQIGLSNDSQDN